MTLAERASSKTVCQQNVLRKRDQSQAEYEGRLEAAVLRRQEERTPVRQRRVYAISMNFNVVTSLTSARVCRTPVVVAL